MLVVESSKGGPRAQSVMAYGQSSTATSPWYGDQRAVYARGKLKPVAFSKSTIAAQLVRG